MRDEDAHAKLDRIELAVVALTESVDRVIHLQLEDAPIPDKQAVPPKARKAAKKTAAKKKAPKGRRSKKTTSKRSIKKTGKQFAISAFVIKTLGASKKPMRGVDIAAKLSEAAQAIYPGNYPAAPCTSGPQPRAARRPGLRPLR